MTRGLLTPLSPSEEIALRRVANGSPVIDTQIAGNLCRLALIERTPSGFRLTPLGRQRYDALPKALLLAHRRSLHAVSGYVEGLLEKAQLRVRAPKAEPRRQAPRASAAVAPKEAEESSEGDADDHEALVMDLCELRRWKVQAAAGLEEVRKSLLLHRARDAELCAASRACIETSQLLLSKSTPTLPAWLAAMH